jgi:hypothetical protein
MAKKYDLHTFGFINGAGMLGAGSDAAEAVFRLFERDFFRGAEEEGL